MAMMFDPNHGAAERRAKLVAVLRWVAEVGFSAAAAYVVVHIAVKCW
jgi:hypothetical protein